MDFNYTNLFQEKDFPVVFFDRRLDVSQGDSVTVDTFSLTKQAVLHLISQGHERIAFIGGHNGLSTTEDRLAGYKAALEEGNIEYDPSLVEVGDAKFEAAYDIEPELYAASYYGCAKILLTAIENAGTTDRDAVRDEIEKIQDMQVPNGVASCDESHDLIHNINVAKIENLVPIFVESVSVE